MMRRIVLSAAVIGLIGVAPATGQPGDPAALLHELSDAESSLKGPGLSFEQRLALMDRAVQTRASLIAGNPGDERAPTWLVDQAAAMLDRLGLEGTDTSVLFGIPTSRQRERAQGDAWSAMQLVARADEAAGKAVRLLQARVLDAAGGPVEKARAEAERAEAALSRLIDTEQSVRIPYYRGRAAALLAALEPGGSGRGAREEHGRVAMESLANLLLAGTAGEATRRVTLGAVLLALWPRDDKPRGEARELFQWVANRPPGADAPGAMARAQAWMGLLRCARDEAQLRSALADLGAATRREPFVVDGKTDPLLALLAAEAAARAMLAEQPREIAREARLSAAFAPLVALLTREDLRDDQPALRGAALAKIGAACDLAGAGVLYERLDPWIGFARGVALAQAGPAAAAVAALEQVAARGDAGDLRPAALWELAVMSAQGPGVTDAADAAAYLCRLGREFPESPRAGEAAVRAVELARYTLARLAKDRSAGGPASADVSARLSALYGDALELAYRLRPGDPETLARRLERARLVLDAAGQDLAPAQLDTALDALEGVRAGEKGAGAEQRRQADELAGAAVETALRAARRTMENPEGLQAGRERLAATARRAVQWAQVSRPALADSYRLILGETLLDSGDARALPIFEELAGRSPAIGGADAWRIGLGLGRSQRLAGRPGDAFATLRGLVEELDQGQRAASPGTPPPASRPPQYWAAWAEMLEILGADNAGGKRSQTIRVQISRLRLLGPELGGVLTRARIEAVARAVGVGP